MVDRRTARKLALALPEAAEEDHHGFPSYRVRGKIFATEPDPEHLHVMLDEDGIWAAVRSHPRACEELYWGSRLAAVRVQLAEIDAETLNEWLRASWRRRAPKSLARELE